MQQQTFTLSLRFQLFLGEPGLALAPAVARRLDLRFDRFAFPAPCHVLLYVARWGAQSVKCAPFSAAPKPVRVWLHYR